jgi:hypothetical protein
MRALTANRLSDGEAVFWSQGGWVERFVDAQLFEGADEAETAEASAKSLQTVVVDPYLIDLIQAGEIWAPLSYRERIRCLGPTNHPQHGKQAEGGADIEALVHAEGAARSTGRVNLIKRK